MTTTNTAPEESTVSPRLLALVLPLLVVVPYVSALGVGFVWDDRAVVLGDPAVTAGQPLAQTFTRSFWPESDLSRAFFRPLTTLSYRMDWLVHGENAAGFHFTNLVLHAVAAVLLFVCARRLGARPLGAFGAALAWALLPRLTEAVTWIAGRTDVLAAVFSFGAIAMWPWGVRSAGRAWAAALLLVCGMLSKEVTLAAAMGVVVAELGTTATGDPSARLKRLAPIGVALGGYGALRHRALSDVSITADGLRGLGERVFAAATALGHYVAMVVDPLRPRLQIGLVTRPSAAFAALGGLGLLAAVAASVVVVRRSTIATRNGVLVGVVIAAVSLFLVLHLVPIPVNVSAADRFMYFPAAGAALALATLSAHVPARPRRVLGAVAAVLAACGAAFVHLRTNVWADELALWSETTVEAGLENPIPLMELGNVAHRAGAHASALVLYEAAARRLAATPGPAERRAAGNVGVTLGVLGRYEDALRARRALVARYPELGGLWLDVARAELHALRFDAALASVDEARRAQAAPDEAARLSALIVAVRDEARAQTGGAVPLERRARFETRAGRIPEALAAWRAVVTSPGPVAAPVLDEAATFLLERGRADDLRTLAQRSPDPRYVAAIALREEADRRRDAADAAVNALGPLLAQAW